VLSMAVILYGDLSLISFSADRETHVSFEEKRGSVQVGSETIALTPGELPGYTGWARPASTLAGFFSITSISKEGPRVGMEFTVKVWCHRHDDCLMGTSLFYLRAYGPSVIPGVSKHEGRGKYTMVFVFPDPGRYTVEAVLTFSNPPAITTFPLSAEQEEPAYEGYLLPGFPLVIDVQQADPITTTKETRIEPLPACTSAELLDTSVDSAVLNAHWKVVNRNSVSNLQTTSSKITREGYLRNVNSLGIQMAYEYSSGCTLLPSASFDKSAGKKHPFSTCGGDKNIHIIFVGDSVMRVQWDMFKTMTEHLPNVQSSYITLYGGYRRVTKLEDDSVRIKLDDIYRRSPSDIKVIFFNTGLHDIHRLCGSEWRKDRYEYMDNEILDSGTFSCIKEYKALIHDFADLIHSYDAKLRVFQSTTAGWPKYGNFGIDWPFGGQTMPLATEIIPFFNEIAYDLFQTTFPDVALMDGYWITYCRPDNREVGTIGSKLSHPGLEVLDVMSRISSMLILERICKPGN